MRRSYDQRLQCPTCGVRLLYDFRGPRPKTTREPAARWQQTPWGRILIGLVLAQGLYFALYMLLGLLEVLNSQRLVNWTWTSVSGLSCFCRSCKSSP